MTRCRRSSMRLRARAAIALVVALVVLPVVASPSFAVDPLLSLGKSASVTTAKPGDSFEYTFVAGCSDLTLGCVNAVMSDTIPAEVTFNPPADIVQLPPNTTYTWDPGTRLFRVVFSSSLGGGAASGMPAGSSLNIAAPSFRGRSASGSKPLTSAPAR